MTEEIPVSLRIRCEFQEDELVRAVDIMRAKNPTFRLLRWILLIVPLIGIPAMYIMGGSMAVWTSGLGALFSVWYVALLLFYRGWVFLTRRSARRVVADRNPHDPVTFLEVTAEGLRYETVDSWELVPWERLSEWIDDEELILIKDEGVLYRILPRRCFVTKGDYEYFTGVLREKIGPPE